MEVFTDFATQSSDSVTRRTKKMGASRGRSEKNAIRVCGDWSEQLSSKGKIYFYNCITEVSQWQKPPEWKLPDMNPDELLRLLAQRSGHNDGNNLKRARPSLSSSCSMSSEADRREVSPKRTKILVDRTDRATRYDVSASSIPDRKTGISQKRDSRTSQNAPAVPEKGSFGTTSSRAYLTDDMEISPNSSPLSNSSSPSNANLSPCFSRGSRINHQRHDAQYRSSTRTGESSPGTLRQLVDAIRASIGGLLEYPPKCSESPAIQSSSTGHNRSRPQYTTELRFRDPIYPSPSHSQCKPTKSGEPPISNNPAAASPHGCKPSHINQGSSREHSEQLFSEKRGVAPTEAIPGLVSTLTTLVNLIGSTKPSVVPPYPSPHTSSSHVLTDTSHKQHPTSPLVRLPSSMDRDRHELPARSPEVHSHSVRAAGLQQTTGMRPNFGSPFPDPASRVPSSYPDNQNARPSRFNFPSGPSHQTGRVPQDVSPNPTNRRRRSDVSDFSSRLVTQKSINPLETSRVRHSSGSLDGSDPPHPENGRCRASYSCSKRLNGFCKSPCCTEVDNSKSPISRLPTKESPSNSALHWSPSRLPPVATTSLSSDIRNDSSSSEHLPAADVISTPVLDSPTTLSYIDGSMKSKFKDLTAETIEKQVHDETKVFEELQSVFYGEHSVESKKLRALIRISDAKLAIHREKQTALQQLMEEIESRRFLRNMSFSDDGL